MSMTINVEVEDNETHKKTKYVSKLFTVDEKMIENTTKNIEEYLKKIYIQGDNAKKLIRLCKEFDISEITIDVRGTRLAIADYVEEHSSIKVKRITSNIYHDDKKNS